MKRTKNILLWFGEIVGWSWTLLQTVSFLTSIGDYGTSSGVQTQQAVFFVIASIVIGIAPGIILARFCRRYRITKYFFGRPLNTQNNISNESKNYLSRLYNFFKRNQKITQILFGLTLIVVMGLSLIFYLGNTIQEMNEEQKQYIEIIQYCESIIPVSSSSGMTQSTYDKFRELAIRRCGIETTVETPEFIKWKQSN